LKEERAQSITIDSARVFFFSKTRDYMIMDAPGHIEFIRNMVTGAARAEAALLVIDAKEGVMENSRRHGYLAWMLGIKQIVVLVNKMDLVDYQETVFEAIKKEYGEFLGEIGLNPSCFIPVSGSQGDLITKPSRRMAWYSGNCVLDVLDTFIKKVPLEDNPLRLPVQDIYKFTSFDDERRIVAGTIASGKFKVGDEIVFYPSMKSSQVKSIEAFATPVKMHANQGEAVGFTLQEQIFIERGEIAALAYETPPEVSMRMRVSLFWLGKRPLVKDKQYLLKLGTARVKVHVEEVIQVINAAEVTVDADKEQIDLHDVAECVLSTQRALVFDLSETLADTSRFVIVDENEICGGGIILESLPDSQLQMREEKQLRNLKWIKSDITNAERAEAYKQTPMLVIITGKHGSGRKTIARKIEKQLFQQGKFVYYLGMGSVVYGINLDIEHNGGKTHRREHIRRLAELVHILMDTGLIVLITALELSLDDLQVIATLVDAEKVEVVWVGDAITTNVPVDLHIPGGAPIENSVQMLRELLEVDGAIFGRDTEEY
ncbi:MAG: GTP-binding protein, partial [Anaerolineaceae bacterium]|nr:GTP-binding protein [Anaerolineaceae bacterium]